MKNEIKEILECFSSPDINFSEMLFNRDERLLDYITNLQEENKKVHKDFDELSERYFFTKSRNEKAIEYIELGLANEEEAEELLNILQGGDK